MLLDLLILAALMYGLYWFAGKVIDDVLDSADDVWSQARAREEIGRRK